MLITILWALVYLCIFVAVVWLVLWVLGKLGIAIPANVLNIIWVILVLLCIIWIISHFSGAWSGHRLPQGY
jgi:hypothetical protein